jgi:hypothetical protein
LSATGSLAASYNRQVLVERREGIGEAGLIERVDAQPDIIPADVNRDQRDELATKSERFMRLPEGGLEVWFFILLGSFLVLAFSDLDLH